MSADRLLGSQMMDVRPRDPHSWFSSGAIQAIPCACRVSTAYASASVVNGTEVVRESSMLEVQNAVPGDCIPEACRPSGPDAVKHVSAERYRYQEVLGITLKWYQPRCPSVKVESISLLTTPIT